MGLRVRCAALAVDIRVPRDLGFIIIRDWQHAGQRRFAALWIGIVDGYCGCIMSAMKT